MRSARIASLSVPFDFAYDPCPKSLQLFGIMRQRTGPDMPRLFAAMVGSAPESVKQDCAAHARACDRPTMDHAIDGKNSDCAIVGMPYVRTPIRIACVRGKHGRAPAPQQRDPRFRSGPAGIHKLRAGRDRDGDRDEHVEVRRRCLRNGAQFLGCAGAARRDAIHAQQAPDRRERHAGAGGDADGAHPTQWWRAQSVACEAGARPRRLRRAVAAHFHRRPGAQRGRRLSLSKGSKPRPSTTPLASAATVRPPRSGTGD